MQRVVPLVPTLMVAVMLAVLCSLGFWQIDRMHEKNALLARYQANSRLAPAPLPATVDDPEALAFRRVVLDCRFEGAPVLSPGGSTSGKAGQHVYALCRDSGREDVVAVDLGWMPFQAGPPATDGFEARIEGIVRPWTGHTFVENLSGSGRVSPASFTAGGPVAPVFVQAERILPAEGGAAPAVQPSPLQVEAIPNNHRSYAIQWFAFATILLIIYGVYLRHWRRLQRQGSDDTVRRS